jgi:hypothetical protein
MAFACDQINEGVLILHQTHQKVNQREKSDKNEDKPKNPGSDKISTNGKKLFHRQFE